MSTPLLPFAAPCRRTLFLRREKRFTALTRDPATGEDVPAHTNNTGSMLGLLRPGVSALLSPARAQKSGPPRKLAWTLEALDFHGGWVGVNTLTPNRLLRAAWAAALLPEARGYTHFRPEAFVGDGESRLDARLEGPEGVLYVECKNVTLVEDDRAIFPDAATERGRKHLVELMRLRSQGARAALFFLVQRPDGGCFGPAEMIDPEYTRLLAQALEAGVEAWPWRARITPLGIDLGERLPVFLG